LVNFCRFLIKKSKKNFEGRKVRKKIKEKNFGGRKIFSRKILEREKN